MRAKGGATLGRARGGASGLVLLAALAVAPACASDDAGQTSVDAFCSGVCDAVSRCRLGNGTCGASCAQSSDAARISREGAQHLGDCLADIDCAAFSDDAIWKDQFAACWQSSKALVPVSARVRSVCSRYVEAYFECGSLYSTRQCELDLGMWSDEVLEGAESCLSARDCDGLDACEKAVFNPP